MHNELVREEKTKEILTSKLSVEKDRMETEYCKQFFYGDGLEGY